MCEIGKLKIHRNCKTLEDPIVVFVVTDNGNVGLCSKCWAKIAETDLEWGKESKPTIEDIFGRRAKEEAEATLTEYRQKDIKQPEDEKNGEDDF